MESCFPGQEIYTSGALVHELHKLPRLGRSEVDVIGGAVPASDADSEPARAGAESGLALGQCAQ